MSRGTNPRVWSVSLILVLIVALSAPLDLLAQDETSPAARKYRAGSGPAGMWVGQIRDSEGEKFEIRLQLDKDADAWKGILEDPFQGTLTANRLTVTQNRIGFTFRTAGAPFPSHFAGIYIAGDDRISGTISQRGNSVLIKFKRDPDSIEIDLTDAMGEPIVPKRIRHPYRFAVTGRMAVWPALHVVKAETYNINTLTSRATAFDGSLKFFVLDEFNVFARTFRGGLNFTDDAKIANFMEIGLTSDSYLKLDGWEIGGQGFLGNILFPESTFNPYLTGAFGKATWELTQGERGTDVIEILDHRVEGTDWSLAAGLGTEYEIRSNIQLELEFLWRYFLTEDELIWEDPDNFWSNTHAWSLSVGLTWGIW
jgi:hypothetical protein